MLLSRQVKLDLKIVKQVCLLFFFGFVCHSARRVEVNTTFSCQQALKQ